MSPFGLNLHYDVALEKTKEALCKMNHTTHAPPTALQSNNQTIDQYRLKSSFNSLMLVNGALVMRCFLCLEQCDLGFIFSLNIIR